jgi:hypothetical protein
VPISFGRRSTVSGAKTGAGGRVITLGGFCFIGFIVKYFFFCCYCFGGQVGMRLPAGHCPCPKCTGRGRAGSTRMRRHGVTESFNGKFRDECLSLEWFRSRAEAKVIIETWRQHYNEVRPHSSLDYLTPNEFVARGARSAPRKATGRDAAVHGASAPRPVAQPSLRGQMQPARGAVSS